MKKKNIIGYMRNDGYGMDRFRRVEAHRLQRHDGVRLGAGDATDGGVESGLKLCEN
jgi:hypothetical protein